MMMYMCIIRKEPHVCQAVVNMLRVSQPGNYLDLTVKYFGYT
jgi:hypothetical protein